MIQNRQALNYRYRIWTIRKNFNVIISNLLKIKQVTPNISWWLFCFTFFFLCVKIRKCYYVAKLQNELYDTAFSWSLIYGSLSILILSSCIHCLIKPNRSNKYKKFGIRVNCIKVEVTKNRNIFMSPENLLVFLSPYPYTTFVTLRPKNYVKN